MCREIHFCKICGTSYGIEDHHIVFKSQCKPLDKCIYNHVYLCPTHHRDHRQGVHFNRKLDKQFKGEFKSKLKQLFTSEAYCMEDIKDKLRIGNNAVKSLCKTMWQYNGKYKTEDIIRTCMGGGKNV
jgi:hypothetical protein